MKIELIQKYATKTSRGMLSKAWYKIDDKIYLVKGNSVDPYGVVGLEPYSEVMASQIAKVLQIDHLNYTLMESKLFPEVQVNQIQHVSVCEYYVPSGFRIVSFYNYIVAKLGKEPTDYFEAYRHFFPMKPLYQMLLFDALIGNEDRHLSNIDILIGVDGSEKLAPLYDHGASLLAWHSKNDLAMAGKEGRFDSAKPFRTTHEVQTKLISEPLFPKIDLNELYDRLIAAIRPVFTLLPEDRADAIAKYLHWRMKYIGKVMA